MEKSKIQVLCSLRLYYHVILFVEACLSSLKALNTHFLWAHEVNTHLSYCGNVCLPVVCQDSEEFQTIHILIFILELIRCLKALVKTYQPN